MQRVDAEASKNADQVVDGDSGQGLMSSENARERHWWIEKNTSEEGEKAGPSAGWAALSPGPRLLPMVLRSGCPWTHWGGGPIGGEAAWAKFTGTVPAELAGKSLSEMPGKPCSGRCCV